MRKCQLNLIQGINHQSVNIHNRIQVILIRNLLFILGVISLFIGPSVSAQMLPEGPTKGARLFVTKGCVKCHALKGEGGRIGPDLGKIELGDTQLNLVAKIWNHIPSMILSMERAKMIKPMMDGQEFSEISAYLYFFKFFDEPGNAIRGRALFSEKGCQNCHPFTGKGRQGEPGLDLFPQNLSPIFLSQVIWNHGQEMIARMAQLGMKWPKFNGAEMMDLLEFIKTNAKGIGETAFITPGSPKEGKRVFSAKGCFQCHRIHGEGAKDGDDLGKKAKRFYKSLTQIASIMWNKGEVVLAKMARTPTGIPKLSAKEMADLLSFLYFLHFIDEPGNPLQGKKLFSEKGCAKCHQLDGRSGEWMSIELSKYQGKDQLEIVANIWNHSIEIQEAAKEKGLQWPQFKKGEVADLLEYIRIPKKRP